MPSAKPPLSRGLFCLPSAALCAVRVCRAAAGDMVQIPPPAIRANVIEFALTAHPTKIIASVRRAFVRQNHECKAVHTGHGRRLAPLTCAHVHPSRPSIELSADTSIRHEKLERKNNLTFFAFYQSSLRSRPPTSQSSATAGSTRAASATAASCAASGSASRAGFSHACHVERATPAIRAACAWLRLQSLRMCFNRPLMVCRYSAAEQRLKSGLSVYSAIHPLKNRLTICCQSAAPPVFGAFATFSGGIGYSVAQTKLSVSCRTQRFSLPTCAGTITPSAPPPHLSGHSDRIEQ